MIYRPISKSHEQLILATPEQSNDSFAELLAEVKQERFTDSLCSTGAILFRSCDVDSAERLNHVSTSVFESFHEYLGGGSPRTNVHEGVYTSTEYPPQATITQHIEGSYLPHGPSILMFCCVTPPTDRGQTPICDMRKVLSVIAPDIADRFRELGVRYINNLHGGRGFGKSWMDTFGTNDQQAVEQILHRGGYDFEWKSDGGLRTALTCPATAHHRDTGHEYWFNQAPNWHPGDFDEKTRKQLLQLYGSAENLTKYATFGDGSEIEITTIEHIKKCLNDNLIVFDWQRGDLLMLDNQWIAHGRQPFSGDRKILVSMSTD